jgi:MFS family permease
VSIIYWTVDNVGPVVGCIFMYITASAPNKRSLGATNGLSQMAVSISRAVGPALSTSLFSFSVQHNILRGYGVYLLLSILVLLALVLASLLPTHLPGEKDTET